MTFEVLRRSQLPVLLGRRYQVTNEPPLTSVMCLSPCVDLETPCQETATPWAAAFLDKHTFAYLSWLMGLQAPSAVCAQCLWPCAGSEGAAGQPLWGEVSGAAPCWTQTVPHSPTTEHHPASQWGWWLFWKNVLQKGQKAAQAVRSEGNSVRNSRAGSQGGGEKVGSQSVMAGWSWAWGDSGDGGF